MQVPAKPWRQRKDWDAAEAPLNNGTSPSGDAIINPDLCFVVSEGLKRWKEYFTKFLVEGDLNNPTRTETDRGVSLKLLDPTLEQRGEREDLFVQRAISLDHAYLNKRGTYALVELRRELNILNNLLPEGIAKISASKYQQRNDKSVKKSHFVEAVVDVRKILIQKNPQWAENRKAEIEAQHNEQRRGEKEQFQSKVNTELEQKLFSFSGCVARGRFSTVHDVATPQSVPFAPRHASVQSESTAGWGVGDLAQDNTPDFQGYKIRER